MFDLISSNGLIQTMDKSMTLSTKRLGLIASNLANIDTPGYHTQDFSFQDAMKSALEQTGGQNVPLSRTHSQHFSASASTSLPPTKDPIKPQYERNDGNDVSLDRESVLLARTQLTYQLSANFAQVEMRRIYAAIRDGKA